MGSPAAYEKVKVSVGHYLRPQFKSADAACIFPTTEASCALFRAYEQSPLRPTSPMIGHEGAFAGLAAPWDSGYVAVVRV
ncbi:hypothetical protein BN2475_990007 [Paraburkholderia ribeironis]|uniref:Uncharacterized protein n=1 Tax=Paraburkholderia ribeironis TaxID=1247936 RepID=A0A1N7SLS5_9BURK|nr:hypothetical protein BN2475_990007 [Paraburkholderia ribeironis]